MKHIKNQRVTFVTRAAMIAAVYVVLSTIFAPLGTKAIQVRFAEALTSILTLTLSVILR